MSSTRLLVLGVVRIFQPVHGYDVRRELLSWHADKWASVNPGSIYAPDWLYGLSRANPFTYVVEGTRAAFRGDIASSSVLAGALVTLALVVLGVWWGTRTFQRETA